MQCADEDHYCPAPEIQFSASDSIFDFWQFIN